MTEAETSYESRAAIEFEIPSFFSEEGVLGRSLTGYEVRPEQVKMAQAVWNSLIEEHHLIVEAGTGVGKSFAYLIPAIQYAKAFKKRIVVSTYTKTLQHQLIDKDIPFLKENLDIQFNASLCMGSENYICLNRLERTTQSQMGIFETEEAVDQLNKIIAWTKETKTGLRTELSFEPLTAVWEEVGRQGDLCLGKKCRFKDLCFYKKARALWNSSDILIVNHYLFFTNLRLEGTVLPDYHAVIFDEAHNIEDVASRFFGFEIKWSGIKYILARMFNQRTGINLISRHIKALMMIRKDWAEEEKKLQDAVNSVRMASFNFFNEILQKIRVDGTYRIYETGFVHDTLSEPLEYLASFLRAVYTKIPAVEKLKSLDSEMANHLEYARQEIMLYARLCMELVQELEEVLYDHREDSVYWIEIAPGRREEEKGVKISSALIDVAKMLKENLFDRVTTVLTSATLSAGGTFKFIKNRLGLEEAAEALFKSPFDYKTQAMLYAPSDLPDPSDEPEAFYEVAFERIEKLLRLSRGRAFVLLTNREMMEKAAVVLSSKLPSLNFLIQGQMPQAKMLEIFKSHQKSVILGVDTFWQGIDVPGEALQMVIIPKLPFPVPTDPIVEARADAMKRNGMNPFLDYFLPQAAMMLKQGFGRLIRTKDDLGIVAVLDPRIKIRSYGRFFMKTLPECLLADGIESVEKFLAHSSSQMNN